MFPTTIKTWKKLDYHSGPAQLLRDCIRGATPERRRWVAESYLAALHGPGRWMGPIGVRVRLHLMCKLYGLDV